LIKFEIKAAEEKAGKAEEELQALLKKQKATEEELNSAKERLQKV
jgi:predicted  nucleic acid-binding Zn-ribbon protein